MKRPPRVPSAPALVAVSAWARQRTDEPFDVRAYLASRAEPAKNAAPLYIAALRPICGNFEREISPLVTEISELANVEKLASGEFDQRRIDDVLSKAAPALARIDAIQEKHDCVFITGLTADATLPHAFAVPTVARLAVLQMKQSRASGDMRSVEAAIRRALRLSGDMQPRGLDVCQLVSMSMDDNVIRGIQRLVLTDPELTVEHIDRILQLLRQHQQLLLNRAATQLAAVQALLVLRRYEISHGRLPSNLEMAAAETVLKTAPLDPFDGQTIRFAIIAGQATVYSVGQDLKDDGGQLEGKIGAPGAGLAHRTIGKKGA